MSQTERREAKALTETSHFLLTPVNLRRHISPPHHPYLCPLSYPLILPPTLILPPLPILPPPPIIPPPPILPPPPTLPLPPTPPPPLPSLV